MPRGNHISGVDLLGLLNLLVVLGVIFLPMIVSRGDSDSGESDSDSGSDDGWRKRPPPPPSTPPAPRGGIPLDDAEPARTRLRDHSRLADARPRRERRPAREPARRPVRTRTHR